MRIRMRGHRRASKVLLNPMPGNPVQTKESTDNEFGNKKWKNKQIKRLKCQQMRREAEAGKKLQKVLKDICLKQRPDSDLISETRGKQTSDLTFALPD